MPIILEHFIIDFLDAMKVLIACIGIFNMPLKKSKKSLIISFILLGVSSIIKWSMYENQVFIKWLLLFMIIYIIFLMQCLFSVKMIKGVLLFFLLFFMNGNLDGITSIVILAISGNSFYTIEKMSIYSSIIIFIFLLLLIFSCKKRVKGNYLNISNPKLIFLIIISFINSVFLSFLFDYLEKLELIVKEKVFTFLIIGIVFEMYLQIYLYIFLCINASFYKDRNYLNNRLLEAQKKQFKYLWEKEEATKRFRHDLKSHIYILKTLCEKQDWKAMDKYIERMDQENIKSSYFLQTGNSVVDAICNLYLEKASKENISILLSGNMPEKINIEEFDLCTIFSNLLSNAIEAVKLVENKKIYLEIRYNENDIYIKQQNDFTAPVKYKENRFLTIKKNKDLHGYGIYNIKESVYKYDGDIQIDTEGGKWKMNIYIPYKLLEN